MITSINKKRRLARDKARKLTTIKDILKTMSIWFLMFLMVFAIVYVMVEASDREYEASLEKDRIYFERIQELKK